MSRVGRPRKSTEEFIKQTKTRNDCGIYYDYSKVKYISAFDDIIIICPRHGEFTQSTRSHLDGCGCRKCYDEDRTLTTTKFLEELSSIREDNGKVYDYSSVTYTRCGDKIDIICRIHGLFSQTPTMHKSGHGCPRCGKITALENKIQNESFSVGSSIEARDFFRKYIKEKNYDIEQVFYNDKTHGLKEWFCKLDNRWICYDFVVFERGHRGQIDNIIEIIEYHGPWHYTYSDVIKNGNNWATPWKNITIAESYLHDKKKYTNARYYTANVKVIWSKKYHNNIYEEYNE